MGKRIELTLNEGQREALEKWSKNPPKPYLRDRARAIVRIADGETMTEVAASLRTPVNRETVRQWVKRFKAEGRDGLKIKPGRGRKPAFSPSVGGSGARSA